MHPKLVAEVQDLYINQISKVLTNVTCRFAYTFRTFDEQNSLYAQGRTKLFDVNNNRLGIITNAKGGQSFHNYGVALDIVLINGNAASWDTLKDFDKDGIADWMEVVKIFKDNGYVWGGDFKTFKDYPHFEKTFGYTWQDLLLKYNNRDFIKGTSFVNI